ncbi:Histidine phosphatase superfamily, clade-1 [Artemisia annua]|uniref:Histidine phosphatase superfamily, clade-1 n=1 Tax=Artemisia annua TaxID=35608 RepID=A0A2U1L9G5_ARTAN|nr:Histidine phosphatase superfamily, clade-1 [Artemisia annua]
MGRVVESKEPTEETIIRVLSKLGLTNTLTPQPVTNRYPPNMAIGPSACLTTPSPTPLYYSPSQITTPPGFSHIQAQTQPINQAPQQPQHGPQAHTGPSAPPLGTATVHQPSPHAPDQATLLPHAFTAGTLHDPTTVRSSFSSEVEDDQKLSFKVGGTVSFPPLKAAKRVVLVRHGQSTWNAEGRIQGSSDFSILTNKGEAQAETSRQMLIDDSFDICFSR